MTGISSRRTNVSVQRLAAGALLRRFTERSFGDQQKAAEVTKSATKQFCGCCLQHAQTK